MTTTKVAPKPNEKLAACGTDICIESQGDINIYNCTAPRPSEWPCPPPKDDHVYIRDQTTIKESFA